MERYTWDRPRIGTDLDAIKFICKEFWVEVFRKQARRTARHGMACSSRCAMALRQHGGCDLEAMQQVLVPQRASRMSSQRRVHARDCGTWICCLCCLGWHPEL